jgi:hypothetical protein
MISGPTFLCEEHLREYLLIPIGPIAMAGKCDFSVGGLNTNAYRDEAIPPDALRSQLAQTGSDICSVREVFYSELQQANQRGDTREEGRIRLALDAFEDAASLLEREMQMVES